LFITTYVEKQCTRSLSRPILPCPLNPLWLLFHYIYYDAIPLWLHLPPLYWTSWLLSPLDSFSQCSSGLLWNAYCHSSLFL